MNPPKWPLQFLRWFCREDYLEEIEGDLTEVYIKQCESSPRKAKWRFVWSVVTYFRPQFVHINIHNTTIMTPILSIKKNPYVLLLFTTMALLFALAFRPIVNLDFQDKTVFTIPLDSMVWAIPLLLLSLWLFYVPTSKFLYSRAITWIHVLITVITTLLIVTVIYVGINPSPYTSSKHELSGSVMHILSMLFVLGQLAYLTNILVGLSVWLKAR